MQLLLSPAQLPAEMLLLLPPFFAAEWIAMFLDKDKMQCMYKRSVSISLRKKYFAYLRLFKNLFRYICSISLVLPLTTNKAKNIKKITAVQNLFTPLIHHYLSPSMSQ